MKTAWVRSRPFVWSICGHAVLLGLLFVAWKQPIAPTRVAQVDSQQVSAVEATLVAVPPQQESGADGSTLPASHSALTPAVQAQQSPSPESRPSASIAALPAPDVSRGDDAKKPVPDSIVAAQTPPTTEPPREPASLSAASPQQTDANSRDDTSQPSVDSDDPYAEMRRQRAEAERQYQREAHSARQPQDRQAPNASAIHPQAPGSPMMPSDADPSAAQWTADGQPPSMPLDFSGGLRFANGLQSMRCPVGGFRTRNDFSNTAAWVECLLNPSKQGSATQEPWWIEQ